MRRERFDVSRVFKTHRLGKLPPLAAYVWWRVSDLDPRLWPASCERWQTIDGSESRLKELWSSMLQRTDLSSREIARVRQACLFLRKWKDGVDEVALERTAIEQFVSIEDDIKPLTASGLELATRLNQIMRRWLSDIDLTDLPFQHGPGTVAELSAGSKLTTEEKFEHVGSDDLIRYTYPNDLLSARAFRRCSRLVCVPKTYSSLRTICAEPATLQFYQQGVMRRLYGHVARHRFLRRHLPLHDQSVNALMALRGSSAYAEAPYTVDSLCTIDLSAASDRLSWEVVKKVFAGTPLLRHLWATRSRSVELPDGREIAIKKFAPMGSALCFPIQSLVYAAVVEDATRSEFLPGARVWSVFGDDIVVHALCYDRVCEALSSLGLVVNVNKSFDLRTPFKESCGIDAWDGEDITPFYLRSLKRTPENLLGLMDLAGRLSAKFPVAAGAIYTFVLDCLPPRVRSQIEIGPDAFHPFPYQLNAGKVKWHAGYQRSVHPALSLKVRRDSVMKDEWAYVDWLLRARTDGRLKSPYSENYMQSRVRSVRVVWR